MKVKEYLNRLPGKLYFIVDSHQGSKGLNKNEYYETDFNTYEYKLSSNKKIQTGSLFLYRRPGTSSRQQFNIYGGGVFGEIEKEGVNTEVSRRIVKGFRLKAPLMQGDPYIEEFDWKFKSREHYGSWRYFFTQYGITGITADDFWNLVGDLECVPVEDNNVGAEETAGYSGDKECDYTVTYSEGTESSSKAKTHKVVSSIDFDALNKKKKTIGTAGELIVLNEEIEKLKKAGIMKRPEYVADTIGDGLGYDILSYDETGEPIYIEVKTTTGSAPDGFFMSSREVEESVERGDRYRIYRVYNLDAKNKKADIRIYKGAVNNDSFTMKAVDFRIYNK